MYIRIKRWLCAGVALMLTLTLLPLTKRALATEKTVVTIAGVTVAASKEYDGAPVTPAGEITLVNKSGETLKDENGSPITLAAGDLVYRFVSTDGGGYDSASAPKDAGAYSLTVTVRDDHPAYTGTSAAIPFTILPRPLAATPESGKSRYVGCANPTFAYAHDGAVAGETPAFAGELAGAAGATDPAGVYAVTAGTLALADNAPFLAKNYALTVASATYRVAWYSTDAKATAADTNRGANGVYTGDVTFNAPAGYEIASALGATGWGAAFTKSDCVGGENRVGYHLRVSGGENAGAITERKLLSVQHSAAASGVSLYSPAENAPDAAVSSNQKIILWASKPVTPAANRSVTVSDGANTYTAAASSADLLGGANGAWYLKYDMSDFAEGGTTLALINGATYTVTAEEGAFEDAAGNGTARMTASFATVASGALTDPVSAVYTLSDPHKQSVAVKNGGAVVSGQAVERGAELCFTLPPVTGFTLQKDVRIGGAAQAGADLTGVALTGDFEAYVTETPAALSGTASIAGTAQVDQTLTASLKDGNNTGALSYAWKRGSSALGTGASYTVTAADLGYEITIEIASDVQTGVVSSKTAAVTKADTRGAPAAPTLAVATPTSITLNGTSGYEYSLGGVYWQDTTTFHNLQMGARYSFYQRVKETANTKASAVSPEAVFATIPALTGTIMSSGEPRYGITLTAELENSNNTGALLYTWKRGTLAVGTGTTYNVSALDIGNQISVEVSSSVQGGVVTRVFGTANKAYYFGNTPAAPTRSSRTTTRITLNAVEGCEYSRGGASWQDSPVFSGLKAGTSYTFYQRYKATATMEASDASAAYKTSTSSSSSSSDDSSGSDSSSGDSASDDRNQTGGATTGESTLYSYTLTGDNTRILYSVLQKLAEGNKTQDVTIKQNNVDITFEKGTLTANASQLWYDFGTTINGCIHEQTAKALAGDAYVATIHYNFEGTLPGKARVRFWLGAAQAGKTLYYYKLDNNALTYLQSAVADSTGWVEVQQESCSDYVFLNRDINAAATPTPAPSATPLPTSTPLLSATDASADTIGANGWLVAAMILLAVLLILGGIWLFVKNRNEY